MKTVHLKMPKRQLFSPEISIGIPKKQNQDGEKFLM